MKSRNKSSRHPSDCSLPPLLQSYPSLPPIHHPQQSLLPSPSLSSSPQRQLLLYSLQNGIHLWRSPSSHGPKKLNREISVISTTRMSLSSLSLSPVLKRARSWSRDDGDDEDGDDDDDDGGVGLLRIIERRLRKNVNASHVRRALWGRKFSRFFSNRKSYPPITFEPTYKLQPDWSEKFNYRIVENILENETKKVFTEGVTETYNDDLLKRSGLELLRKVKKKIRSLSFKRYVIVVHLVLVQNLGQGVQSSSKCLWDADNDNRATYVVEVGSLIVEVTAFGVYKE